MLGLRQRKTKETYLWKFLFMLKFMVKIYSLYSSLFRTKPRPSVLRLRTGVRGILKPIIINLRDLE